MNIKIFGWGGFVETAYNRDGYDRESYNWKKLLTDNIYYKSKNEPVKNFV